MSKTENNDLIVVDSSDVTTTENPFARYEAVYSDVEQYHVENGRTYFIDEKGKAFLAPFIALPLEQATYDNGVDATKAIILEGITDDGVALPRITVPIASFEAMNWPKQFWGAAGNIFPAYGAKAKLAYGILEAAKKHAPHTTIYTHTGWKCINGQYVFLYGNGAIGADSISVELDPNWAFYDFPAKTENLQAGIQASKAILDTFPLSASMPLLAYTYLAPLTEFFSQCGCTPSFVMYLYGLTGTLKSNLAAFGQAHFGSSFAQKHVPASFNDTAQAIADKGHTAKDVLLQIDDYHPTTVIAKKKELTGILEACLKVFGDRVGRSRLNKEMRVGTTPPAQALALMTGEDIPELPESRYARMFPILMHKAEAADAEKVSLLQQCGRDGLFAMAMRGYIEWLLPKTGSLSILLHERLEAYRKDYRSRLDGAHLRSIDSLSSLMIGCEMMLQYWQENGVISEIDKEKMLIQTDLILLSHLKEHSEDAKSINPTEMFFTGLHELERKERAYVVPKGKEKGVPKAFLYGVIEGNIVFLRTNACYDAVINHYSRQEVAFPLTASQLWKDMLELKITEPGQDGKPTWQKKINGKNCRCIAVKREYFDTESDCEEAAECVSV